MRVIQVKISESYTPARERTGKREISGILSFVRENPNGRFGRYDYIVKLELKFIGSVKRLIRHNNYIQVKEKYLYFVTVDNN